MKSFQLLITFFFAILSSLDAQQLKCAIQAKSAILYNPDNGAILFERNSDEPRYPASIIKVATALFILDAKKTDLKTECYVSKEAIQVINAEIKQANPLAYPPYILEHDGVCLGLKEGQSYPLETLLYGLLLASGNDAANVIAENCSGTIEKFMEELNEYLKDKGLRQTRLQNPHGLYHPAQMTTAYDMAQITALAFQSPTLCKIAKAVSFEAEKGSRPIVNHNGLIKEGKYQYPKILGGKTGFTESSGYNLIAAAQDQERKLIVVLLGCDSSEVRYKDAIALFETAFREKPQKRLLFTKKDHHFPKLIKGTKELYATLKEDVEITYFPSEERPLRTELIWNKLTLPIYSGHEVGKLVVDDGKGHIFASSPLYAQNTVKSTSFGVKLDTIIYILLVLMVALRGVQLLKKKTKIFKR